MNERIIWQGKPSQLLNLGVFLSSFLVITLPLAFLRWKLFQNTTYSISTTQISIKSSYINKGENNVDLSLIKDLFIESPLFLKLFSLSNIVITTHDESGMVFAGVKNAENIKNNLIETLNNQVSIPGYEE